MTWTSDTTKDLTAELAQVDALIRQQIHSDHPLTQRATEHLFAKRGKRLRARLVLLTSHAQQQHHVNTIPLATIVELIHNATLAHDDVIDRAEERRSQQSLNQAMGNKVAVLIGDYLYSIAFQLIAKLNHPAILQHISETTQKMVEGELKQCALEKQLISLEHYYAIITAKTGLLFAAATHCSGLLSNNQQLWQAGLELGLAYQIIDDTLDCQLNNQAWTKNHGDDLKEGKCTLPSILFAEQVGQQLVIDCLTDNDPKLHHLLMEKMHSQGILEQCRHVAMHHLEKARGTFAHLPEPEVLLNLCDNLHQRLV